MFCNELCTEPNACRRCFWSRSYETLKAIARLEPWHRQELSRSCCVSFDFKCWKSFEIQPKMLAFIHHWFEIHDFTSNPFWLLRKSARRSSFQERVVRKLQRAGWSSAGQDWHNGRRQSKIYRLCDKKGWGPAKAGRDQGRRDLEVHHVFCEGLNTSNIDKRTFD